MNSTQDGQESVVRTAEKTSTGRTILEYVVLAVVAIAVALLIQAFLIKPYRIPSPSMEDTLLVGEDANQILTSIPGWPTLSVGVEGEAQPMLRPAILEV